MSGIRENEASAEGCMRKVGVYLVGSAQTAGAQGLLRSVEALPEVVLARAIAEKDASHAAALAEEMRGKGIAKVVLIGAQPGLYRDSFARALQMAHVDQAEIRQVQWRGSALEQSMAKARADMLNAVQQAHERRDEVWRKDAGNPATLVIGGGVAGIQAALEIAASGSTVYVVERTGTIGGRMAMFDKTFPTLDCAACILTPKMVAAGQNANIKLLTLAEVAKVSGEAGAFHVHVTKHARRVDESLCVACGDCVRYCPTTVPSEFDVGAAERKAIYIPFPQAIPNAYMIDGEHCLWQQSEGKKCGACVKKCTKEAIDLDARDEELELDVGNIIVATGFDLLDPGRVKRFGYGEFPNVLSALEFERLTNASGPTGGRIVMKQKRINRRSKQEEWVFDAEGERPKSVAIVHCVGSRDRLQNAYCSRVCCMYSLKFAHLVREKLPAARCYEFYIDMRAFGKGYEEFSERIRQEEVTMIRGRGARVEQRDGGLHLLGEDVVANRLIDLPVDLVILSSGLVASHGAQELGEILGIAQDESGWFCEAHGQAEPETSTRAGIYLAGVCQGPKDIPDTVAQASAAAAHVLRGIVRQKRIACESSAQSLQSGQVTA